MLAVFVTMNTADLLLTLHWVRLGAEEINPFMAWLLGLDPLVAGAYKLGIGTAAALILFSLRRYRRVLEASVALTACFSVLTAYHAFGLVTLAG